MQAMTRLIERQFHELTRILPIRNYNKPSLVTSQYLQCPIHIQIRHFVKGKEQDQISNTDLGNSPLVSKFNNSTAQSDQNSELPSSEAHRRHAVVKKFSHLMDRIEGNIFTASQRINDITGYSGIEDLKTRISNLEGNLQDAQNAVRNARLTYKTTVADRTSTQREVTTLLARKDSWSPSDLERFTTLYRMDHSNEQAVQEASIRLANAEREVEHASSQLRNSILSRYHEEQIWSDKIRRMSTWGTWGLMGVNVLLFLVFQFGFEPWRRRRLIEGFEGKVLEALEHKMGSRALDGKANDFIISNTDTINSQDIIQEPRNEDILAKPNTDTINSQDIIQEPRNEDTLAKPNTLTEAAILSAKNSEKFMVLNMTKTLFLTKITNASIPETLEKYTAIVMELFSDKIIEIRKQDVLIIAVESAVIGATIATTIFTTIFYRSLF